MTRALVVYESVFGDARAVAEAVADGLSGFHEVTVVAAGEAPAEIGPGLSLLVVGGPTHMFGMPRPASRESAVTQHGAEIADTGSGLREWLESVQAHAPGLAAAAFDTRSSHPRWLTRIDHADRTETKLLGRLGATIVAPAEHFAVADTKGPLVDGELERAAGWGRTLGELTGDRTS